MREVYTVPRKYSPPPSAISNQMISSNTRPCVSLLLYGLSVSLSLSLHPSLGLDTKISRKNQNMKSLPAHVSNVFGETQESHLIPCVQHVPRVRYEHGEHHIADDELWCKVSE